MRLIYFILCSLVLFWSTSCNDFLDDAPRGNKIAETIEDYDKLFNDSQGFNMVFWEQYYTLWRSDDLLFTEENYESIAMSSDYPTSVQAAIQYEDKIYRDDEVTPEINNLYNLIYKYNLIIDGLTELNSKDPKKTYLLAEARVVRAYAHFLLAQWYAMPYNEETATKELAVPIVTKANTQVMDYNQATVKDLYTWIITEMEESCPNLEKREEHKMRCYMATGYALMGKVYFFMNKYDKALTALQTSYNLLDGDKNVYLTNHIEKQVSTNFKEINLYSLLNYIPYPYRDNEALYCMGSSSMRSYNLMSYGIPTEYLKPEIYALFNDYDLRRNMILTKNAVGKALPYPTATFIGAMTNIGCKLQEVYLMLAECEARVGSAASAKTILKKLRETRFVAGHADVPSSVTDKNSLIRFCVEEQTREFVGTGYKFYNVRRLWNDPLFQDWQPVTHTVGNTTYTLKESNLKMKFPQTVLQWNTDWK